jgi:sugar phosphate isomerase/epimerase
MNNTLNRRALLGGAGALAAIPTAGPVEAAPRKAFRYCLNTSTIREAKLPLDRIVALAAKAGYDGIEPWLYEIERYVQEGGSLSDLRKRIDDAGLTVEDAIAFPAWVVDDDARRVQALEEARKAMDLVRQIGGTRIAAPPAGATDAPLIDLRRAAERYRALLEVGDRMGVTPIVEVWGFSKNLQRLGETAMVAIEAHHPKAAILTDVYHLYRGGSEFSGVRLLNAAALPVLHMNDYPAKLREELRDSHRVYPGEGVAPITQLLRDLKTIGFQGALSLELFNPELWRQDPAVVAKTGLEKMKSVLRAAAV